MRKERVYNSGREILGGSLVLKGARGPVPSFFDHRKAGNSREAFPEGFPRVKRSQVLAVFQETETVVVAHA